MYNNPYLATALSAQIIRESAGADLEIRINSSSRDPVTQAYMAFSERASARLFGVTAQGTAFWVKEGSPAVVATAGSSIRLMALATLPGGSRTLR